MHENGKVDYIEFSGRDLAAVKSFYGAAFGWTFVDHGPTCAAFNEGLDGGFDGDAMETKVTAAGGAITKPVFSFPGGRRFHFMDPAGNELAVWSEG